MKTSVGYLLLLTMCLLTRSVLGVLPDTSTNGDLGQLWQSYWSEQNTTEPALTFPFQACFTTAAESYNIPATLLLAVARGESDFDPKAESKSNAHGIMQIQWPETAHHLGFKTIEELQNPCRNIKAGAKYLRELLDRYSGDVHKTLAAYNYGPGRIKVNMLADALPEGARWYSGYIHRHLQYVLGDNQPKDAESRSYDSEQRIHLLTFNRPYRAESFVKYINQQTTGLRIDWFKVPLGRFKVVLLARDNKEVQHARKSLNRIGLRIAG